MRAIKPITCLCLSICCISVLMAGCAHNDRLKRSTSPKEVLVNIYQAISRNDYDDVKNYIYPTFLRMPSGKKEASYDMIISGIKEGMISDPENPWVDLAYTNNALLTIIEHSHRFKLANSEIVSEFQKGLEDDGWLEDSSGGNLLRGVIADGGLFALLGGRRGQSMIVIARIEGNYKLVLWKQIIILANWLNEQ